MDDYKLETNRFLSDQNRRINEGKRQHDELTREGNALQKSLREGEERLRQLREERDKTNKSYEARKSDLENQLKTMKEEIVNMEGTLERKKTLISERTPDFIELEKQYETKTADYERVKKEVVTLKN